MFVDKVKRTDQNKIEEFKSRGVACQFNAIAGKDFVDKFWHVARDSSINTTLAKGTERGVKLYQIDLPGFYLQSEPDDATFEHEKPPILYISMLPGFAEKDDDGDEAGGVLTASMYGTAIAGRAAGPASCPRTCKRASVSCAGRVRSRGVPQRGGRVLAGDCVHCGRHGGKSSASGSRSAGAADARWSTMLQPNLSSSNLSLSA